MLLWLIAGLIGVSTILLIGFDSLPKEERNLYEINLFQVGISLVGISLGFVTLGFGIFLLLLWFFAVNINKEHGSWFNISKYVLFRKVK